MSGQGNDARRGTHKSVARSARVRCGFVLLFPDQEVLLTNEGDYVFFGPDVAHSYRCEEDTLILTVR